MDGVKEDVIEGDCTPRMDSGVVVKQEPAWSMEGGSRDQPSAVYSTAQPMSDNTSGSLLSLNTSSDRLMSLPHGRLSSEEMDHVRKYSAHSETEFVLKLEPAWSMEEDSLDQPSSVYGTVQPMSVNISESLIRGHACQHCSAAFVLVSSLELHLASVHGETLLMVLPESYTPDRFDADNCSNTDIDKEVDSHGDRNTSQKRFDDSYTGNKGEKKKNRQHVCNNCGKSFSKLGLLNTHKLIHSGIKPFACDVCGKSFTQAGNLKNHKRIHTGERPYKCPHCESEFNQSGALHQHIKSVHEGARPHVCDVCGAAFSITRDLTVHMRVHTGEKPHVCPDCGTGFAHSSTLRKHRLTHTGEKLHVCSDCGKRYTRANTLRRHHLIHTGQKPHSCPHCPAAFTLSQYLKKHIQSKHL